MDIALFLANLLIILVSAKIFGALAERWGQPTVLGELFGGVVLGLGFIPFFKPQDPVLSLMAECGVALLLFETGLESDLHQLLRVGPVSAAVACVGVVLPFFLGWGLMAALGHGGVAGVLVGSALTATSVGITARVLGDMGQLQRTESQIVLGAAVIDDVLGVIILSVVQAVAVEGGALWSKAGWTAFVSHAPETAMIIGAFAAGILLAQTKRKREIHSALKPVSAIVIPVFFILVGAKVDLRPYTPWVPAHWPALGMALLLIVVAIGSKALSGGIVWRKGLNRWAIGIGMIPRGEVGLIFAQIGLSSGAIDASLYTALIGMVLATTLVTPPLLRKSFNR